MAKADDRAKDWEVEQLFVHRVRPALKNTAWILRITEHAGKPAPLFIVKERISPDGALDSGSVETGGTRLVRRGLLYGSPQRRVLPVIRDILRVVTDEEGIPLELHRFLSGRRIEFRGNLPLSDEAGFKLALIFKLRERVQEVDRVELIARRVERFTREEASYWFSRMTNFGADANRWARAGMRTMLGGQSGDPAVQQMLAGLKDSR